MWRWVCPIAGAEAAAFGPGGLATTTGTTGSMAFLVVAVAEIPALCTAQGIVLRDHVPGLRWWWWTLATGSIAAVAWGAAILATSGSEGGVATGEPPIWLRATGYIALGAAAGFLMGLAQRAVLRRHVQPGAWIGWNTVAWAAGMPVSSSPARSRPMRARSREQSTALVVAPLLPAVRGLQPLKVCGR